MVTLDEEVSGALGNAKEPDSYYDDVEAVAEWYAVLLCQGFRSRDEDISLLVDAIEEHWPDFEDVDGIEIHRLASEKTP